MPVAVVQDWVEPVTEHSTESYDRITERLGAKDDPPQGLLMHSAGHTAAASGSSRCGRRRPTSTCSWSTG